MAVVGDSGCAVLLIDATIEPYSVGESEEAELDEWLDRQNVRGGRICFKIWLG